MLPRFFAPDLFADGSSENVTLPEEEARHATGVLRLRVGDELAVFDGHGHEWQARIATTARGAVTVRLEAPLAPAPEARVLVTLLQAVLKGDHMDAVVRDVTMLGVAEIRPVITVHTAVSPRGAGGTAARARWQRVAIASAKQCRRAVVPPVSRAVPLEDALTDPSTSRCDHRIVLAEPGATHPRAGSASGTPRTAVLAVGPEGGWSREELERLARAGFTPLTLGALTLRADAAAMVALSVLRERWQDV